MARGSLTLACAALSGPMRELQEGICRTTPGRPIIPSRSREMSVQVGSK